MIKQYEIALVISPKLSTEKVKELQVKITELLKTQKGKIKSETKWEKLKLAYPINKEKEAQYLILYIEIPNFTSDLIKKIKLSEGVMRYLLLRR